MSQVQISFDEQMMEDIRQTEVSVQHWSVQYSTLMLQLRGMESTLRTLHSRRQGLVQKILKDGGIDLTKVVNVDIDPVNRLAIVEIGASVSKGPSLPNDGSNGLDQPQGDQSQGDQPQGDPGSTSS